VIGTVGTKKKEERLETERSIRVRPSPLVVENRFRRICKMTRTEEMLKDEDVRKIMFLEIDRARIEAGDDYMKQTEAAGRGMRKYFLGKEGK